MAGLDWTHIFSPKLVNEFKLGYNRWQLRQSNQDLGNDLASTLGIMGVNQIDGHSGRRPGHDLFRICQHRRLTPACRRPAR